LFEKIHVVSEIALSLICLCSAVWFGGS